MWGGLVDLMCVAVVLISFLFPCPSVCVCAFLFPAGNTASYLLDGPLEELRPLRPQRYIGPGGIIQPYDHATSQAMDMRWNRDKKTGKKQQAAAAAAAAATSAANASASPAAASSMHWERISHPRIDDEVFATLKIILLNSQIRPATPETQEHARSEPAYILARAKIWPVSALKPSKSTHKKFEILTRCNEFDSQILHDARPFSSSIARMECANQRAQWERICWRDGGLVAA
jgi:hypothetical protein